MMALGHARILDMPISRHILGESKTISDYMPTIFEFNYINIKIPDIDAWAVGDTPLEDLALYTDGQKIYEGTGAGLFCPSQMIKHSYKLHGNSGEDSCYQESDRNGKKTME